MTAFIKIFHERIAHLSVGVDKTIDSWFLMHSPVPVISIVAVYLVFVLKIGPLLMRNRKAHDLKKVMVAYNALQVVYSIYMCRTSIHLSNVMSSIFSSKCEIVRNREENLMLYSAAWYYFFSKIIDLLDTTFFVLRKKQNQVSFLHVYHHTVTAFFSWCYLKYAPGEQGVIIGILNSGVHIIMYFYYMVSAMGPKYQKYLWWKKYMTTIQLIQFVVILSYMLLIAAKGCNMPKSLTFFFVGNTIIFILLFGNFYRKTYNNANRKGNAAANAALNAAKSFGCSPHSNAAFMTQTGQMRWLLDTNNNSVNFTKAD